MGLELIDRQAERLLQRLAERGETVATAESLTGGGLAARLTDVPGASRSFVGAIVAYATRIKETELGVSPTLIEAHGVISRECATAMATGVRARCATTWGIATTGVAGPDRQDDHLPGTVWVAVAGPLEVWARRLDLSGTRQEIRAATCTEAMSLLDGILIREEPGLR